MESTGLNLPGITMTTPQCTAGGSPVACSAGTVYSKVQIGATYDVTLLTPLVSIIMGGPVHMSAATTAAIQ